MSTYKDKYIKYKNKYLELKYGGSNTIKLGNKFYILNREYILDSKDNESLSKEKIILNTKPEPNSNIILNIYKTSGLYFGINRFEIRI